MRHDSGDIWRGEVLGDSLRQLLNGIEVRYAGPKANTKNYIRQNALIVVWYTSGAKTWNSFRPTLCGFEIGNMLIAEFEGVYGQAIIIQAECMRCSHFPGFEEAVTFDATVTPRYDH